MKVVALFIRLFLYSQESKTDDSQSTLRIFGISKAHACNVHSAKQTRKESATTCNAPSKVGAKTEKRQTSVYLPCDDDRVKKKGSKRQIDC